MSHECVFDRDAAPGFHVVVECGVQGFIGVPAELTESLGRAAHYQVRAATRRRLPGCLLQPAINGWDQADSGDCDVPGRHAQAVWCVVNHAVHGVHDAAVIG